MFHETVLGEERFWGKEHIGNELLEILPLLPDGLVGSHIDSNQRSLPRIGLLPRKSRGSQKALAEKRESFKHYRTKEERVDVSIGSVCKPCTHMLTVPYFAEPACHSGGNLKVIRLRVPLSATAKGNRTPTPRSGLTIPVGSLISLSKCFPPVKHAAEVPNTSLNYRVRIGC